MSDNSNYSTNTVSEINSIAAALKGKVDNVENIAARAIAAGHTVQQFRDEALARLPEARPIMNTSHDLGDVKPRDWQRYSIARAMATGCKDGIEAEMSAELPRRTGMKPTGAWVPDQVLFQRTNIMNTASLGGSLVQTSVLGSEFVDILRNKSQILALGARVLNLDGPVTIPVKTASGTTHWLGSETAAATLSSMTFGSVSLYPKIVSCYQNYSAQLLKAGNADIDNIVRNDLIENIATAIDLAAIHGGGTAEPVGLAGTTGIGTVALSANGLALGNATAYPALVSLESIVAGANGDFGNLAYLMRPQHRSTLRTVQRFASTDSPVFLDGKVNSYRAEVTAQLKTNLSCGTATTLCSIIAFGDWSQVLIGQWGGGSDLIIDPYSLSENGVTKCILRRHTDIAIRTPSKFAILGGIL